MKLNKRLLESLIKEVIEESNSNVGQELTLEMSQKTDLRDYIKENPGLSVPELASELGLNVNSVRGVVGQLKRAGEIEPSDVKGRAPKASNDSTKVTPKPTTVTKTTKKVTPKKKASPTQSTPGYYKTGEVIGTDNFKQTITNEWNGEGKDPESDKWVFYDEGKNKFTGGRNSSAFYNDSSELSKYKNAFKSGKVTNKRDKGEEVGWDDTVKHIEDEMNRLEDSSETGYGTKTAQKEDGQQITRLYEKLRDMVNGYGRDLKPRYDYTLNKGTLDERHSSAYIDAYDSLDFPHSISKKAGTIFDRVKDGLFDGDNIVNDLLDLKGKVKSAPIVKIKKTTDADRIAEKKQRFKDTPKDEQVIDVAGLIQGRLENKIPEMVKHDSGTVRRIGDNYNKTLSEIDDKIMDELEANGSITYHDDRRGKDYTIALGDGIDELSDGRLYYRSWQAQNYKQEMIDMAKRRTGASDGIMSLYRSKTMEQDIEKQIQEKIDKNISMMYDKLEGINIVEVISGPDENMSIFDNTGFKWVVEDDKGQRYQLHFRAIWAEGMINRPHLRTIFTVKKIK